MQINRDFSHLLSKDLRISDLCQENKSGGAGTPPLLNVHSSI